MNLKYLVYFLLIINFMPSGVLGEDTGKVPKRWKKIEKVILEDCMIIYRNMSNIKSQKVNTQLGTIELFDKDQNKIEKSGCQIDIQGPFPKTEKRVLNFFKERGWRLEHDYLADGPDGGMTAYSKDGTFCKEEHKRNSGGLNEPLPTEVEIRIVCVPN